MYYRQKGNPTVPKLFSETYVDVVDVVGVVDVVELVDVVDVVGVVDVLKRY